MPGYYAAGWTLNTEPAPPLRGRAPLPHHRLRHLPPAGVLLVLHLPGSRRRRAALSPMGAPSKHARAVGRSLVGWHVGAMGARAPRQREAGASGAIGSSAAPVRLDRCCASRGHAVVSGTGFGRFSIAAPKTAERSQPTMPPELAAIIDAGCRTAGRIRRPMLYPVELRAQKLR